MSIADKMGKLDEITPEPYVPEPDYKALYEVQKVTEQRLKAERDAARGKVMSNDRSVPYVVHVELEPHRLDYRIDIRVDSYMLRANHPGGFDHDYLRFLSNDVAKRAMKELGTLLGPGLYSA